MVQAASESGVNAIEAHFLRGLGEQVRTLRARRGMTRKALAKAADVSERHLANLEQGQGNVSVLILFSLAQALKSPMAELLGDVTTSNSEWLLLRSMLEEQSEETLRQVRLAARDLIGGNSARRGRDRKRLAIALIGLRGAGKTTLGKMLADSLEVPFVELSREIETLAGCGTSEIQALYGQSAYRRYERRALEEVTQRGERVVIATPGGVVSDPATFGVLLESCLTVWLQARPEDHMRRVLAQGDTRPIEASAEAMEDLRSILRTRSALYSKSEIHVDTSAQSLPETFEKLRREVQQIVTS
jgi:XRE family aerobic/anaerobic benzoate catabolism transcriptional regulator